MGASVRSCLDRLLAVTATDRELESKFEVTDDLDLSGFCNVARVAAVDAPVEFQLDAEYYDTADHRLAAAGIGLRRRTGGDDAGWHLEDREIIG